MRHMSPYRDITFDLAVCEGIIVKTKASPTPGAAKILRSALNRQVPSLIAKVTEAPISGSSFLHKGTRNTMAATQRLLWRLGFSQDSLDVPPPWPPWGEAILAMKDHGSLQRATDVEDRLRHLVEEIFWLRGELAALDKHLLGKPIGPGAPNRAVEGLHATHMFVLDTLPLFSEIFQRRPATSRSITKTDKPIVFGPTVRFVSAVLQAIRDRLEIEHGSTLARNRSLNPSQYTLEGWIRKAARTTD